MVYSGGVTDRLCGGARVIVILIKSAMVVTTTDYPFSLCAHPKTQVLRHDIRPENAEMSVHYEPPPDPQTKSRSREQTLTVYSSTTLPRLE